MWLEETDSSDIKFGLTITGNVQCAKHCNTIWRCVSRAPSFKTRSQYPRTKRGPGEARDSEGFYKDNVFSIANACCTAMPERPIWNILTCPHDMSAARQWNAAPVAWDRDYIHTAHTQLARPSEEVAGLWVKTGELVTQTSGKTTEKSFWVPLDRVLGRFLKSERSSPWLGPTYLWRERTFLQIQVDRNQKDGYWNVTEDGRAGFLAQPREGPLLLSAVLRKSV